MADDTMRSELNDAKEHVKDAVRASLMAMRNVVDFALNKLDGDGHAPEQPERRDDATSGEAPPPPPPVG
jgi:hypothetical protein